MKQLITLTLLLLVVNVNAQSHETPIGAKWFYSHPITEGNFNKIGFIQYSYSKDSLIDGKSAQVISVTKHQSANLIEYFSNIYIHQQGDSTLVFNPHSNQFNLLYNFGAKTGDTITVFDRKTRVPDFFIGFDSINQFKYIILKVDTVTINNIAYKRQFYKNDLNSDWRLGENTIDEIDTNEFILEKIGGSRYFLGYSVYVTVEQNQPLLRCYNDSNTDFKNPSRKSDCDYYRLPTGLDEVSTSQQYDYSINEHKLEFNHLETDYQLYIYSTLGNLLVQQEISPSNNKISTDKLAIGLNCIILKHPSKKTIAFKLLKY